MLPSVCRDLPAWVRATLHRFRFQRLGAFGAVKSFFFSVAGQVFVPGGGAGVTGRISGLTSSLFVARWGRGVLGASGGRVGVCPVWFDRLGHQISGLVEVASRMAVLLALLVLTIRQSRWPSGALALDGENPTSRPKSSPGTIASSVVTLRRKRRAMYAKPAHPVRPRRHEAPKQASP